MVSNYAFFHCYNYLHIKLLGNNISLC